MKRLFLLGLILLISMTTVLATFSSTIKFSSDISSDNLPVKQRSGYYVWGALNRLKPVTITVNNQKTICGYNTKTSESKCVDLLPITYLVSGYIKFNNIPIGAEMPVSIFNTILSESDPNDPLGDYIIQYSNGNSINSDFYVRRIDQNTYEIVCKGVPIRTRAVLPYPWWIEQNIIWDFTATMTV